MKKENLRTPAILLNIDALENNIKEYQKMCDDNGKELWPMTKTHKSKKLMQMQIEAGATGALCGTLDEAEAFCDMGVKKIMYAYPVASIENIERVIELSKKCDFIIRLDNYDGAKMINDTAEKSGMEVSYTIIVDSGLHRFGVPVDKLVEFADKLKEFKNLKLRGLSTHPGHVYGATNASEVHKYVVDECETLAKAKENMEKAGYKLEYITSGSTPTILEAVKDKNINVYHPGNYVFLDTIQLSIGRAEVKNCALTVYATIISHPSEDLYICDAGAKCLGLDQGAHGNASIVGYGTVKGHPELTIDSLSEEVGKLHAHGKTDLKVGDKIEIIPNHSCSTANLCSYYTVIKGNEVIDSIPVDVRGNSFKKI